MRFVLPLLFLTTTLFAAQGDVTYAFKEGKIQFLSEKTPQGEIVGLLKTLKPNTTVDFIEIDSKKSTVSFVMSVKEENPICRSWTDIQTVVIALDPKPVDAITLEGKNVKSVGKVTILTPKS